mgnify:CR=1 FL=1
MAASNFTFDPTVTLLRPSGLVGRRGSTLALDCTWGTRQMLAWPHHMLKEVRSCNHTCANPRRSSVSRAASAPQSSTFSERSPLISRCIHCRIQ